MTKYSTILLLGAILLSCNPHGPGSNAAGENDTGNNSKRGPAATTGTDYLQRTGDSMLIPAFEIDLHLSTKANEKLQQTNETIIVAAWFSGQPKDTLSREYAESGEMFIKSYQLELSNARTAKFEGIKFSKAAYDSLAVKDIQVLVNVFSGRRSSPDNLLDCGILSDKMNAVKNRTIVLSGKLIGETDSLTVR